MNDEMNDCFEIFGNYCLHITGYSLTGEKKNQILNLAFLGFLCIALLIVFSADPLLLKSLLPSEEKQSLGLVLVF